MTVQEARRAINKCESDITSAHRNLCTEAERLGSGALNSASSDKTKSWYLLIISVIGFVLCGFNVLVALGACLFIGGFVGVYLMHSRASAITDKVEAAQKQLNTTINNNSTI
ncbi:MAG: hypothetical protein LUG86_02865 [Oscillospiraceae bacterium]|nr:hypothetical protein [Oscillospiraceae bacterium]